MNTPFGPLAKTGGSLAVLAAALAFAVPAMAQDAESNGAEERVRFERPQPSMEGRARVESTRSERGPRFERGQAFRPAPQVAQPQQDRPAPRGFGNDVIGRAQFAQQADRRADRRADRIDRRSEQRAERVEQRGDQRAGWRQWQGRDAAAERIDRRTENRADRVEDRGDRRADRVDGRGNGWRGDRRENWRDGRVESRGNGWGDGVRDIARESRRERWRDGNRDGWRDGRRDGWRDGRRDGWRGDRRNWRRDDWRWGWNGRPGWDNRDFRRWDNRWRSNRSYDWFDFRRSNHSIFRPGPYYAPFRSHRYSRLSIGFFLDSLFFQPRFFINDPWAYHLPPAYGPYQWVRYYDDVVLVDIYTGEVVDVIHDFFW